MMGGGFFDNMWDPYSGAYAYPRTQPRARYYAPRGSVYEQRPGYERRGSVQPEKRADRKAVRTIPVTDGNKPVEVKAQPEVAGQTRPVVRFESEDAAATKIQGVYRGQAVRRTEPLKHLRVIMKVREEFEGMKRRLGEREQRMRVCSDPKERLKWTESVMALLLRLDQLQGVHPDVRLIRKAAAKELLEFQEKLDSMSEDNVEGDEEENVEDDSVAEEKSEVCDAAEEGAGDINTPAADAVEEMEVEEKMVVEEKMSNVEDVDVAATAQVEADGAIATDGHQEAMEQDFAPADREDDSGCINVIETSASEQHVPHDKCEEVTNCENQGTGSTSEDVEQEGSELGFTQAAAEVPMDVENEPPARNLDEVKEEGDSPQIIPPMDVESDQGDVSGVDDPAGAASSTDFDGEPMSKEAELGDPSEKCDQNHHMERLGDETERLAHEADRPELGNNGDDRLACTRGLEERATDAGDGWMIPAMQPQCSAKGLQVGQPQISSDTNALSDRALLEQLLEENRKLKDVVGKVLHWGKQQNDIIHNLASRIEQLEEHQPQSNMLHGEKINGRKRIQNDGGVFGDRERSLRSKGRRNGRQVSRPQLGYLDSGWLSTESDEYF